MHLTPHEQERLMIHGAAEAAKSRLTQWQNAGEYQRLNYPEAMALLTAHVLEEARNGRTVLEIMESGRRVLARCDVMEDVPKMIDTVQVEATFPDGTKLVTIREPIHHSCSAAPPMNPPNPPNPTKHPVHALGFPSSHPGEIEWDRTAGDVVVNKGLPVTRVKVHNTRDRAIQVGSHYHFYEANAELEITPVDPPSPPGWSAPPDREWIKGMRLNIPAGNSRRFEPGVEDDEVYLIPLQGNRMVPGLQIKSGPVQQLQPVAGTVQYEYKLPRKEYIELYGPTYKDRVRLADTNLWIEVTEDWAGGPDRPGPNHSGDHSGDEMVFGGGKVIRESMGQSMQTRAGTPGTPATPGTPGTPDTVITGVVVLDHWGVVKADVALRDGYITALGKAYNPDIMNPRHGQPTSQIGGHAPLPTDIVVGPDTEIISGNGKILTAGAVDTHVHFICPEQIEEALASGVTTLIGGGAGPAEGSKSTTVTHGSWHIETMFAALDSSPVNIGLLGQGATMSDDSMRAQLEAGVLGFKVHEDWGATPAVIDACLEVCEGSGVQLAIHTDTLNEAGFLESTREAIDGGQINWGTIPQAAWPTTGRCIHAFHIEGAGGGHAPDIIKLASHPRVLPASTNPTRPLTVNTVPEGLDMLAVAHHLRLDSPNDWALAQSRLRPTTMVAEDILHDMGAISIMSTDTHAMGRMGELILRTWQTAHVMKTQVRFLPGDGPNADNLRARRYVAKYTINPAIAHGIDHVVGAVQPGLMADLVLWEPKFFGVKPDRVIKGGQITYAQIGDANAAIPTPQPVLPRPMFGALGQAARYTPGQPQQQPQAWYAQVQAPGQPPQWYGPGQPSAPTSGQPPVQPPGQLSGQPSAPTSGPGWASLGQQMPGGNSVNFVSGDFTGLPGIRKPFVVIKDTRKLTKADMRENDALPNIDVDPDKMQVEISDSGGNPQTVGNWVAPIDAETSVAGNPVTGNPPFTGPGTPISPPALPVPPPPTPLLRLYPPNSPSPSPDPARPDTSLMWPPATKETTVDPPEELPMAQLYFLF